MTEIIDNKLYSDLGFTAKYTAGLDTALKIITNFFTGDSSIYSENPFMPYAASNADLPVTALHQSSLHSAFAHPTNELGQYSKIEATAKLEKNKNFKQFNYQNF